jgi:cbb3-type cytochrome oxidase maturation protein
VETIFVLLPLALLIAAIAVGLFIWAARTGQFDDLETPAVRILFDDEEPRRRAPAGAASAAVGMSEHTPTASPPAETTADSTRRVPA